MDEQDVYEMIEQAVRTERARIGKLIRGIKPIGTSLASSDSRNRFSSHKKYISQDDLTHILGELAYAIEGE